MIIIRLENKTKIIYSSITLFTALVAGSLFNINNYLPMYLSIGIYIILFFASFLYYEAKTKINPTTQTDSKKLKITNIIFLVILANAVFYSIIKMGQNNSNYLCNMISKISYPLKWLHTILQQLYLFQELQDY